MWKNIVCALFLVFLTGCFQTKDELTINPDGSGTARIETRVAAGANPGMAGMLGIDAGPLYPPTDEAGAKKLFPGKDFVVHAKQDSDKDDTVTVVEVEFKDINSLLASPYGRAHQLSISLDADGLTVKGVNGMETVARVVERKKSGDNDPMDMMGMSGMDDAQMQKKILEMRAEFRITLPNAITTTTGTHDGKTADWTVERAKAKDADDFAQQLAAVLEARCSGDGLKFKPVSPARLALQDFAQLTAGASASQGPDVNTRKVAAVAKFVPYSVSVTRAVDLSGKGNIEESSAQLMGAVVLPLEYAPQKWGEPVLMEALDDKGNDLKPKPLPNGEVRQGGQFFGSDMAMGMGDDDDATNTPSDVRHVVSIPFRPPDWKVTGIGRIEGMIPVYYFSGAEVVKVTNAIPKSWIMNMGQQMAFNGGVGEKTINSGRLSELGLNMTLQFGMNQGGVIRMQFQMEGSKAALIDAQAFDADGKPWPTIRSEDAGGAGNCTLTVIGSPKMPLSLALAVSGAGSTVQVPVLVQNFPLNAK